jgi:biopolymer transport protein ExbB
MFNILLQDTTAVSLPATAPDGGLNALDLLMKGGPVMIPIFILSFAAIYIFVERYRYINRAGTLDPNFLSQIKDLLYKGDVKGALAYCNKSTYPIARLLERGLLRMGQDTRDIESAIESTARVEVYNMERNLSILSAIAAIAPMFGFLGTVLGMIKAFYNISISDNISIGIIAGGMYEKMVTSASGLVVGVMAYMLYTLLNAKIDRVVNKMEVTAIEFLDLLHKPMD